MTGQTRLSGRALCNRWPERLACETPDDWIVQATNGPRRQWLKPSLGHHAEWIHACKTGAPTLCNFDYSGSLVEHNLLGTVAFRAGKKLQWDPKKLKATNCPEADPFIRPGYREGWSL